MVMREAFASVKLVPKEVDLQFRVRAIVRCEDHQRILPQSEFAQGILDPTDAMVHVGDHVDKILLRIFALAILAARRWVKRIMWEVHRIVSEEWLTLIGFNEVDQVIRDDG